MKTRSFLSSTLIGLFLAADAPAQSAAAAAEQLFRDANTLLAKGQTHEACAKFSESQKLDPQLGTLLNLATCHEKEGKVATAWTEYSELVDQAGKQNDKKRLAYGKKKVAELDGQLPHLDFVSPRGRRSYGSTASCLDRAHGARCFLSTQATTSSPTRRQARARGPRMPLRPKARRRSS